MRAASRPIVYVSTLSEPMSKMVSYVQRFSYFDENKLGTEIQYEDIGPMLASDGPASLVPWLTPLIKDRRPSSSSSTPFARSTISRSRFPRRGAWCPISRGCCRPTTPRCFLLGEYTATTSSAIPSSP